MIRALYPVGDPTPQALRWPGRPYTLSTTIPLTAGQASDPQTETIGEDQHFLVFAVSAQLRSAAGVVTPLGSEVRLRISDSHHAVAFHSGAWSSEPIRLDNLAGNTNLPNYLLTPQWLPKESTVSFEAYNDAATAGTLSLALTGLKYEDLDDDLIRRFDERMFYQFALTTRLAIGARDVSAIRTLTPFLLQKTTGSAYDTLTGITMQLSERASGDRLTSGLTFAKALFGTYTRNFGGHIWYPPYRVPARGVLTLETNNASGLATITQNVFEGTKYAR